jgi:PKD repeat protein
MRCRISLLAAALFILISSGCVNNGAVLLNAPGNSPAILAGPSPGAISSAFPGTLPDDHAQPWERLDATGRVVPQHRASSIDANSEFLPGVERYLDSGAGVSDYGEASTLASGTAGGKQLNYATYRIPLGTDQPGAVAVDVNLHPRTGGSGLSSYYLGLSDYAHTRWEWQGPYSDYHVRLSTGAAVRAGGGYTSPLGDLFVCIAAYDGASFDVVGIGANRYDGTDVTAPPAPGGLTAAPVAGGLQLQWNAVLASDIAGYRIYWRKAVFTDPHSPGVVAVNYIEGATLHFLALPATGGHAVAVVAVDMSGNESALSTVISAAPLPGNPPPLVVTVDAASVMRGGAVTVSATGAVSYSFDLNGDGVMDLTNATGVATVDTTGVGIIRPFVIGEGADSTMTALGGVSLIVLGNTRPVASAVASPQSGVVPLGVTFAGTASDVEDPPGGLTYAWDFNGDGIYEANTDTLTPPKHGFNFTGTYNIKFRVTDSQGAWDVDTIAISVLPKTGIDFTVAVSSSVSQYSCAILVGGFPALVYQDNDTKGIYFIRAQRSDGSTWGTPVLVFAEAAAVNGLNMAIVNGNPAIAYVNSTYDLIYVGATEPQGTAWAAPVLVDNGLCYYCELVVAAGNPAIGFYQAGGGTPMFVRAIDALGAAWTAPVAVDTFGKGAGVSTAIVNGYPAMTYADSIAFMTYYCQATDTAGSAWGAPVAVSTVTDCSASDLQVIDGIPCVAFGNSTSVVYFSRAQDENGAGWNPPTIAVQRPSSSYNIAEVSLAEFDGHAAVAFNDANDASLWYAEATDPTGIQWDVPIIIGPYTYGDLINSKPSLLNLNGTAGIVYSYFTGASASFQMRISRRYR